jgi:hypothetical protein
VENNFKTGDIRRGVIKPRSLAYSQQKSPLIERPVRRPVEPVSTLLPSAAGEAKWAWISGRRLNGRVFQLNQDMVRNSLLHRYLRLGALCPGLQCIASLCPIGQGLGAAITNYARANNISRNSTPPTTCVVRSVCNCGWQIHFCCTTVPLGPGGLNMFPGTICDHDNTFCLLLSWAK